MTTEGTRSQRWESEGFELHFLRKEGKDPFLVLLHGAAGNAAGWLPALAGFRDHGLLLVDLPGHGESPPCDDWSLASLAPRLRAAVRDVHGRPAVWGGHSWGGKVATLVAASFPGEVSGLLLVDPSPLPAVPVDPETFVASAFLPELGPWKSVEAAVRAVRELPQYRRWSDALRHAFERGLRPLEDGTVGARVRREWLVAITRATLNHDDREAALRLKCPVLLLVAEESVAWQQATNLPVFAQLPCVESRVVPGDHWLHWDSPEIFSDAVSSWLERTFS